MRSLEERLKTIREGAVQRIPKEHRDVMHEATRVLEESGAADRAVKQGERAPEFSLEDSEGRPVALSDLLRKGPLVLTFFRGHW